MLGETNDCAVLAIAAVLDVSYEAAHKAIDAAGREHREGTHKHVTEKAIEILGYRIRRRYYKARFALEVGQRRARTSDAAARPEAWEHLPDLLLFVEAHVAAFVNGRVKDWTHEYIAAIEEVWELERPTAQVRLGEEPPPVVYL